MQDRRKSFRIVNPVVLVYKVVSRREMQRDMVTIKNGGFMPGGVFSALFAMDAEFKGRVARIKQKSAELAGALELLNNKLNALINLMPLLEDQDEDIRDQPLRETNLSATGVAFANEEPLEKGTYLYLRLLLAPDYYYVAAFARVVGCSEVRRPKGEYRYRIRVEFTVISDQHRELLVKYTMSRELAGLRARRLAAEAEEDDAARAADENEGAGS